MIDVLHGYVISRTAVGVIDGDLSVVALSEIKKVAGLRRSVCHQAGPTLHSMSIDAEFRDAETRVLTNLVQIDGVGPTGAAGDRNISGVGTDKECVVVIAYRKVKGLADRMTMGVGRCHDDRIVTDVAAGRRSRDGAAMGVDAQAGRERGGERQGIAGCGRRKVAGDIERDGLAFAYALIRDGRCGRAAVADREMEGLAGSLPMGVARRHRNRVAAEVAVGWGAGDDAGMGIDAQPGRERGGIRQRIAGCRRREVAGNVECENLACVGALVRDCGCGRAAVADGKLEALADGLTVGVGCRHSDRVTWWIG